MTDKSQTIDFSAIAKQLGETLQNAGLMLATAESCTGGQVAMVVTSVSGSAAWFERGVVAYSNDAKQELLGVNHKTIENYGAVSEQVALEMAEGILDRSKTQVSLAITGVAGPTGGTNEKPVGTVCFAWASKSKVTKTAIKHFVDDRAAVRDQATEFALTELMSFIK